MAYPDEDACASPKQFWKDLNHVVNTPCADHEQIDNALRTWLDLVSNGRDQYLHDENDLARCSRCLLDSRLCASRDVRDYVQTQIVYSLLQEDESRSLHAIANYLLLAGRYDDGVFREMIEAGCFARLIELLKNRREDDRRLHRLLLELAYEMARIERVRISDLLHVDDGFVSYLFQIIEDLSDDVDDPYHYPVIRVLLVLNEQYMVAATAAAVDSISPTAPLTNRVVKVLSLNGDLYRTFGENIILLLNRATETSLQLLILKLLYLLFTTHATYEYFYTNDLRVLLDVIIRNLLDLPNESASLRHTYLRVLYPLLAHTQLNQPPQYKREEILRVLAILSGSGNVHFAPADETTLRLVDRVANVSWLAAPVPSPVSAPASPASPTYTAGTTISRDTTGTTAASSSATARTSTASSAGSYLTPSSSTTTDDINTTNGADDEHTHVVNKFLGISLEDQSGRESRTSVADVAAASEKPGVKTPSRRAEIADADLEPEGFGDNDGDNFGAFAGAARPGLNGDDSQPIPAVAVEFEPNEDVVKQARQPCTTAIPKVSPGHKARTKRVLPAVPRHRHGVLVRPPPPPPADAAAAAGRALAGGTRAVSVGAAQSEAHPTAAAAAAAATAAHAGLHSHPHHQHGTLHHTHGQPLAATPASGSTGTGVKKLPPKAPPPRRVGRLKQAASNANLQHAAADSLTTSSVMSATSL